jgi:hypothetical protein
VTVITKAALAAELAISKARVSQYVAEGLPVRSDGKLDREAAVKWIAENHVDYAGQNRGVGRARKLSAERRRSVPTHRARGNGLGGHPQVPPYMAAVERCENDFDRGVLAMALHIAYTAGARIAGAAVVEGAPLQVAYALKGSATMVIVDQITEFCRACEIGPFADSDEPEIYSPAAFHDVDWEFWAKHVGEPLDI